MTNSVRDRISLRVASGLMGLVFLLWGGRAFAQCASTTVGPCIASITAVNNIQATVSVTLKGFNLTPGQVTLASAPLGLITGTSFNATTPTDATATFTVSKGATGTIQIGVVAVTLAAPKPTTAPDITVSYDTGIQCLESVGKTCTLRFEFETSSSTTSSTNTSNSTTPNIMVKLDYQMRSPNSGAHTKTRGTADSGPKTMTDHIAVHGFLDVGYTQVTAATKVTPATPSATSPTPSPTTTCTTPSSSTTTTPSSTATPSCIAAAPQQAFVADLGTTVGWTTKQDGQGLFAEFGLRAHGSFQDLISSDNVIQSGGVSYVDLSTLNPRNVIGVYEGVLRFKVAQHDSPAIPDPSGNKNTTPKNSTYGNVSSLLILEAGYQNNSGLTQLIAASPQTNTRNRFVGRLSLYPEIPGMNHTRVLVGFEYSAGFNGGPKIVQLHFGLNFNALKSIFAANSGT